MTKRKVTDVATVNSNLGSRIIKNTNAELAETDKPDEDFERFVELTSKVLKVPKGEARP